MEMLHVPTDIQIPNVALDYDHDCPLETIDRGSWDTMIRLKRKHILTEQKRNI